MRDISIFEGVVVFEAEGYTYQAIWKQDHWEMAALEGARVVEMLDIVAPRDAAPRQLLTLWWEEQKKVGTYSNVLR